MNLDMASIKTFTDAILHVVNSGPPAYTRITMLQLNWPFNKFMGETKLIH